MIAATITVGATATRLVGPGVAVPGGERVLIRNSHATDTLFVGGPDLTAATGYPIAAGTSFELVGVGMAGAGPQGGAWGIRGGSNNIGVQVLALP